MRIQPLGTRLKRHVRLELLDAFEKEIAHFAARCVGTLCKVGYANSFDQVAIDGHSFRSRQHGAYNRFKMLPIFREYGQAQNRTMPW
jgi:hypothetical protein